MSMDIVFPQPTLPYLREACGLSETQQQLPHHPIVLPERQVESFGRSLWSAKMNGIQDFHHSPLQYLNIVRTKQKGCVAKWQNQIQNPIGSSYLNNFKQLQNASWLLQVWYPGDQARSFVPGHLVAGLSGLKHWTAPAVLSAKWAQDLSVRTGLSRKHGPTAPKTHRNSSPTSNTTCKVSHRWV